MSTNHNGLHTAEQGLASAHEVFAHARQDHPEWTAAQHMDHLRDVCHWLTVLDFMDAREAMPGWLTEQAAA